MKITSAVLISLAFSAVQAYLPPADQPDGAYEVSFDDNNNPVTKRFVMARPARRSPLADAEPEPAVSEVERRDFPGQQVACTGRNIPKFDYSVVDNCLSTWLDKKSGITSNKAVYYCRRGDTLLAICNFGNDRVYGSRAEIKNFNGVMDRTCGAYRSGYVFIKDWNKTYWRTTWGEEICGNTGGLWNTERVDA